MPSFAATSISGETKTFANLTGRRGLVLVFVRSADWCPFCKRQLQDLNSVAKELSALGWPMVAVSYDPIDKLERFATANKLDYRLLSDQGSKAIDAFGIRNESVKGSARVDGIPHPIILFIGADGIVKAKLYEQRYQDRPPSGLVLETAKVWARKARLDAHQALEACAEGDARLRTCLIPIKSEPQAIWPFARHHNALDHQDLSDRRTGCTKVMEADQPLFGVIVEILEGAVADGEVIQPNSGRSHPRGPEKIIHKRR